MREVFKSAKVVYAWLGEESDRSRDAIKKLVEIANTKRASPQAASAKQTIDPSSQLRRVSGASDPFWNYINKLLSRRWFRRVWIVQELVLAQEALFLCGKEKPVPWDDLYMAAKACVEEAENLTAGLMKEIVQNAEALMNLGALREQWCRPKSEHVRMGLPLLWLFQSFEHTQSSKRRDKLFAFLSLASDSEDPAFLPNYDDKLEVVVRHYASVFV